MTQQPPDRDPAWDKALDWLLRLRDRPEDPVIAAALAEWLDADDAHRRAYARAERVWGLTGAATPRHANRWQRAPIRNVTVEPYPLPPAEKAGRPSTPARRHWIAAGALAACLALACLFGPVGRLLDGADLSSGTGELVSDSLGDGSVITLNAGSAIDTDFTPGRRSVTLLAGEAFFQVRSEPERAFAVRAGETVVTVTGTAFGTRLDDHSVMVEVEEGSVAVDTPALGRTASLRPGQRLTVDLDTGAVRREAIPANHIAAWRRNLVIAEGDRLGDVLDRIRPHFRGIVLTTNRRLLDRPVSGVFDLRRPLEALRAAASAQAATVYEITPLMALVAGG